MSNQETRANYVKVRFNLTDNVSNLFWFFYLDSKYGIMTYTKVTKTKKFLPQKTKWKQNAKHIIYHKDKQTHVALV